MKRIKRGAGFTLVEIIAVLVILAVLAAITVPSVAAYLQMGYQTNRMSVARTIFLAAQNQLTEKRITGDFGTYLVDQDGATPSASQGDVYSLLNITADNPTFQDIYGTGASAWSNIGNVHYISMARGAGAPGDPVFDLLNPVMIDKSVLNGAILIEYNIRTGVVLSAFYSDTAMSDTDVWAYSGTGNNSVAGGRPYLNHDERRQGYYGVGTTGTLEDPLPESHVSLHDADGLDLPSFNDGPDHAIYNAQIPNKNNALYAIITVAKKSLNERINISITGTSYNRTVVFANVKANRNDDRVYYIGESGDYEQFIWVIDYVHGDTIHTPANSFSALVGNVSTNDPITVTLKILNADDSVKHEFPPSNSQYPYFSQYGGYTVNTARHLYNIRHFPDKQYTQAGNVNMTAGGGGGVSNFLPIPKQNATDDTSTFKGTYNGMGYTISNLRTNYLESMKVDYIGLFAQSSNTSTIRNMVFVNADIIGYRYIGTVVGNANGAIDNVTVSNSKISSRGPYIGGIAGNTTATITDAHVSGTRSVDPNTGVNESTTIITGNGWRIGGIAGASSGMLGQSGNTPSLTVSGISINGVRLPTTGNSIYIGGIVGELVQGAADTSGSGVTNAWVDQTMILSTDTQTNCVGGIVGRVSGSQHGIANVAVTNSSIEGKGTYGTYAGGVVGEFGMNSTTRLINGAIVAETTVSGYDYVGGIVGISRGGLVQNTVFINSDATVPITATRDYGGISGNYGFVYGQGVNNVLYLAIAPKNPTSGLIIPIYPDAPIVTAANAYYLSGDFIRPTETQVNPPSNPPLRDGYNKELPRNNVGTPLDTWDFYEMFKEGTLPLGAGWTQYGGDELESADNVNNTHDDYVDEYPYPIISSLAAYTPADPAWPIALEENTATATLFYAEKQGDNFLYDVGLLGATNLKTEDGTAHTSANTDIVLYDSYGFNLVGVSGTATYKLTLGGGTEYNLEIDADAETVMDQSTSAATFPHSFYTDAEGNDCVHIFIPNVIAETASDGAAITVTVKDEDGRDILLPEDAPASTPATQFNPTFAPAAYSPDYNPATQTAATVAIRSPRHIDNIDIAAATLDDNYRQTLHVDFAVYRKALAGYNATLALGEVLNNFNAAPVNGTFAGTYDGGIYEEDNGVLKVIGNREIRNLTLTMNTTIANNGLFSRNSGRLQNINMTNVDISGGGNGNGSIAGNSSGAITNVGVTGATISGRSETGGIVGNSTGTVTIANVTGAEISGISYVGGIAGRGNVAGSNVINVIVKGTSDYTGGIVGYSGRVENCTVTGTLNAETGEYTTKVTGENEYTGGIVGSNNAGTVTGCSVSGIVVECVNGNAGGIAGQNYNAASKIENSNVTDVIVTGGGQGVGGIVGSTDGTVDNVFVTNAKISGTYRITSSFSWGTGGIAGVGNGARIDGAVVEDSEVTGTSNVGGIVGSKTGVSGDIRNVMVSETTVTGEENITYTASAGIIGAYSFGNTGNRLNVTNAVFVNSSDTVPITAATNTYGILGYASTSANVSVNNVLYLALAPRSGTSIRPFSPKGIGANAYYLAGDFIRPTEEQVNGDPPPDPPLRDGYNKENYTGAGTPLNTWEFYDEFKAGGRLAALFVDDAWEQYDGDELETAANVNSSLGEPTYKKHYPYPIISSLADYMPDDPQWPIALPKRSEMSIKDFYYYEEYSDGTYGIWGYDANNELIDTLKYHEDDNLGSRVLGEDETVTEAGYVTIRVTPLEDKVLYVAGFDKKYYRVMEGVTPNGFDDGMLRFYTKTGGSRPKDDANPYVTREFIDGVLTASGNPDAYAAKLPLGGLDSRYWRPNAVSNGGLRQGDPIEIMYADVSADTGGQLDYRGSEDSMLPVEDGFLHPLFAKGIHLASNPSDVSNYVVRTPWQMRNIGRLSGEVNNNDNNFTGGKTFRQELDIDFADDGIGVHMASSNNEYNSTLGYDMQVYGHGALIGQFSGIYEGAKHEVKGITVKAQGNYGTLITHNHGTVNDIRLVNFKTSAAIESAGAITTQNNGTIKGCIVENAYLRGSNNGLGGIAAVNAGTIDDCHVIGGDIYRGNNSYGGIAGTNTGTIKNSSVKGTAGTPLVLARPNNNIAAGIVPVNDGIVDGCWIDYVTIDMTGQNNVGGLVGTNNAGATVTKSGAKNSIVTGNDYVGGVVGRNNSTVAMDGCYNENTDVTGNQYVGGIVGGLTANGQIVRGSRIENSEITGTGSNVGGIAGYAGGGSNLGVTIKNCHNLNGNVTGRGHVGGILGNSVHTSNTRVEGCSVKGSANNNRVKITATAGSGADYEYNGGVTGHIHEGNGDIINPVVTYADISSPGLSYIGGVAGAGSVKGADVGFVSVSGKDRVAGVVGVGYGINESHVNDSVINGTGGYIGGIGGFTYGSVINSSVTNSQINGASQVGGIAGETNANTNALEIRGCEVSGTTVIGSSVSVGGIAGATASATTVSGCHVKPYTPEGGATVKIIVTGTNNIGGIVGYSKGAVSGVSADNANVTGTGNH